MTNEEAELYLKMYIKAYWKGVIVPPKLSVINMAIEAIENQDRYKARTLRYGAAETVAMYDKKHDVYWMKCLSSEMLNALGYEVEE